MSLHRPDALDNAEMIRRLRRMSRVARTMDTAVRIPFVGVRLGLDSVIGLVPGIGDAAGGLVGLYMISEARKMNLPPSKLVRMLGNIGLDAVVGAVPGLGDVFDVFFKAHRRNLDIVLEHFHELRPHLAKDITPPR